MKSQNGHKLFTCTAYKIILPHFMLHLKCLLNRTISVDNFLTVFVTELSLNTVFFTTWGRRWGVGGGWVGRGGTKNKNPGNEAELLYSSSSLLLPSTNSSCLSSAAKFYERQWAGLNMDLKSTDKRHHSWSKGHLSTLWSYCFTTKAHNSHATYFITATVYDAHSYSNDIYWWYMCYTSNSTNGHSLNSDLKLNIKSTGHLFFK